MMLDATLALACAGVALVALAQHAFLWSMRPAEREHGAVGLFALGIALSEIGTMCSAEGHDAASRACSVGLTAFGRVVAVCAYAAVCTRIRSPDEGRIDRWALLYVALASFVVSIGAAFDPNLELDWPKHTPFAWAIFAGGSVLALWASLLSLQTPHSEGRGEHVLFALPGAVGPAAMLLSNRLFVDSLIDLLALVCVVFAVLGRLTRVGVALARRTEEVDESKDSLRSARAELERTERLAAIGEVSAVIAHEIRNPLAVLKNTVTLLRRVENETERGESLLSIVDTEVDRLNSLVADLVAYGKPMVVEPRSVPVTDLVTQSIELARRSNTTAFRFDFDVRIEGDAAIHGDPALLRHALVNIVDNAMKAMPEGGNIVVRSRGTSIGERDGIALDFHDQGEGMDTMVRRMARDPFFTTRATGTGLGLAIVERVARVHGGHVEITSRHGEGTTVSLIVPRAG